MPQIPDPNDRSVRGAPRLRSWLRSAMRLAVFAVAGLVALLVLILLLLQLPFVATPVARLVLTAANPWEGTTATISSVRGTWIRDLILRDLRISDPDGSMVIALDSLQASYDLTALLHGELRFETIRLIRPRLLTGTTPEGKLNFLRPFGGAPRAEPDSRDPE